jgi:hypothetical protein
VTEAQIKAIFEAKTVRPADGRPLWKRLLTSLRIDIKPSKSVDKPVAYVGIKAKADF